MKNYKYLVPILLVVLMALGDYSLITNAGADKAEYENNLTEARKLAELDVLEDSVAYYEEAMKYDNSLELNLEVGELYYSHEWYTEAAAWGEAMVSNFPEAPEAYEYLLKCYIATDDYRDVYDLHDKAQNYQAISDTFAEMYASIEYAYKLGWNTYDEVGDIGSSLIPALSEGLWGYVDTKGKIVITPQFTYAGAFSADGIAAVKSQDGEYYYISTSGNKKIAVQNLSNVMGLSMYSNDMLVAGVNGVYSYYDKDFNKALEGDYEYATSFNGGIAAVKKAEGWSIIDQTGAVISKETYDLVFMDGKGLVFRNDRIWVKKGSAWFMIDAEGNKIGGDYEDCQMFYAAESLAAVKKNGLWGFVDKDGNEVIAPQFESARSFKAGLAAVQKDTLWGYVNLTGKLVIEPQFLGAREFNDGGTAFVETDNGWLTIQLRKFD